MQKNATTDSPVSLINLASDITAKSENLRRAVIKGDTPVDKLIEMNEAIEKAVKTFYNGCVDFRRQQAA